MSHTEANEPDREDAQANSKTTESGLDLSSIRIFLVGMPSEDRNGQRHQRKVGTQEDAARDILLEPVVWTSTLASQQIEG